MASMTCSSALNGLACNYTRPGMVGMKLSSKRCSALPFLTPPSSLRLAKRLPIIKAVQTNATPISSSDDIVRSVTRDSLENSPCVVRYGPFGNQTGTEWYILFDPSESIREITVRTGALVDSIEFSTAKPTICGEEVVSQKAGGSGGPNINKISFKEGEYITRISGATGTWQRGGGNVRGVARVAIHTNLNSDGYGPYGGTSYTTDFTEFTTSVPTRGRVVGLMGTIVEDSYIQSIGVFYAQRG